MERTDGRQIEAAGRCLGRALAEKDRGTLAALLRAAARYVDSDGGQAEILNVVAVHRR